MFPTLHRSVNPWQLMAYKQSQSQYTDLGIIHKYTLHYKHANITLFKAITTQFHNPTLKDPSVTPTQSLSCW